MRISDATLVTVLKEAGKLSDEQLRILQQVQEKTNRPLQDIVVTKNIISEKELTELYGIYINVPFVEIDPNQATKSILSVIPERIARQYNAIVFDSLPDGTKQLAMEDPDDVQALDFIQKYIGPKFKLYIALKENILSVLENYREGAATEIERVIEVQSASEQQSQQNEQISEEDIAEDSPIAQTVNLLLEYAVRANASDIHIEPREDYVQVRYRIDGVLKEANRLPKNVLNALVSRIKILSALKIDERRVPQDGRFKITVGGKTYALRVSTLPISDGEKVVLRILDESNKALTLEQLGYWGQALRSVNDAIVQPHGTTLVTGPTGSGKSTSLFSILSILNRPEVNISTVEDPIEYKIFGANQTQVNPKAGMTFVTGLRALLRQDPNIIMVGEIRDGETADLAIQAALTGHLVFSTLHTNNAATCLPRLLDMGIEPFLIASTVRAVVGQRLVRKLCSHCKETYQPTEAELSEFARLFSLLTPENLKRLHELETEALKEGIGKDNAQLATSEQGVSLLWRAHSGGCKECGNTGYKGRMGIYEVLANSIAIQNLIVGSATSDTIQAEAVKNGMITMQNDGLIKALRGETSIEEILRVTRE
ncbi:MAG TPA: GspE/PulE family protein [Candidatus Saccharimonadales bacterium]